MGTKLISNRPLPEFGKSESCPLYLDETKITKWLKRLPRLFFFPPFCFSPQKSPCQDFPPSSLCLLLRAKLLKMKINASPSPPSPAGILRRKRKGRERGPGSCCCSAAEVRISGKWEFFVASSSVRGRRHYFCLTSLSRAAAKRIIYYDFFGESDVGALLGFFLPSSGAVG